MHPYAIFDYIGAFLRSSFAHVDNVITKGVQNNHMAAPVKVPMATNHTGTLRNLPNRASGTYTNTRRNSSEPSGTFRTLPPEPTPTRAGTLQKPPEPSETFRNQPFGTFRNLPEPTSWTYASIHRNPPKSSGTCLRNLHHFTPELSGTFRNLPPEPTPAHAGTLRNLPEPSSGTCSCDPHRHTPELIWAEDPISLRCWGNKTNTVFFWRPQHAFQVDLPNPSQKLGVPILWKRGFSIVSTSMVRWIARAAYSPRQFQWCYEHNHTDWKWIWIWRNTDMLHGATCVNAFCTHFIRFFRAVARANLARLACRKIGLPGLFVAQANCLLAAKSQGLNGLFFVCFHFDSFGFWSSCLCGQLLNWRYLRGRREYWHRIRSECLSLIEDCNNLKAVAWLAWFNVVLPFCLVLWCSLLCINCKICEFLSVSPWWTESHLHMYIILIRFAESKRWIPGVFLRRKVLLLTKKYILAIAAFELEWVFRRKIWLNPFFGL